jgi:hypothetical protein
MDHGSTRVYSKRLNGRLRSVVRVRKDKGKKTSRVPRRLDLASSLF